MNNKISKSISIAEQAYKNKDYLKSYSLYKAIYKQQKLQEVLFRLADIALIGLKKSKIKLILVSNLIEIGLKNENETKFFTELIYLKLKLLRDFSKFIQFNKLYNSIKPDQQEYAFIEFEYLHYLIETKKYNKAENLLTKIKGKDSIFSKITENFFLDKLFFEDIINFKLDTKHDIIFYRENISTDFNYTVVVVGNPEIFEKEILSFIQSLKKTSTKYLISILIHDANTNQIKLINKSIENLNFENLCIFFENSKILNLDSNATKAYYTARRYILANDMMERFSKTTFVFDADYIINNNLNNYVKLNSEIDISLIIKESFRYLHLTISAGQTMFNCTENSKLFLNFYKKYMSYILTYKNMSWHIDQIVMYVAFIILKRFYNAKIISNLNENNSNNRECFFYHTFHGKYKL